MCKTRKTPWKNFNSGAKEDDIQTSSFESAQPHKLNHVCKSKFANISNIQRQRRRQSRKQKKRKNLQFYLLPKSFLVHHVFFFPCISNLLRLDYAVQWPAPALPLLSTPAAEWGSMCVLYTSVLRVRACRWRTCGCIQQHHGEWPSACCFLWGCEIIPMAEWGVASPWETHINCTASPPTHTHTCSDICVW